MRMANGNGSVYKMKGKRRKPWRAAVTLSIEYDEETHKAKQKRKIIGDFTSQKEALDALVKYHKNPYDIEKGISVKELHDKWSKHYFATVESDAYIRSLDSAWSYCSSIYNMPAKDVRARHIKGCMDEGYRIEYRGKKKGEKIFPSATTKSRIKSLFNLMFDYALEYEIVTTNYARTFEISDNITKEIEKNKKAHIPFTEDEMKMLWDNTNIQYVDWVLIQCYMGWRPQELAILKLDEVDLENWTITGGMKTEAGKQRTIPIHSKIQDFVKKNYDFSVSVGSKTLLSDKGQTHAGKWEMTYDKYANRFDKVVDALKLNTDHRPHDPRGTFITRIRKAGVEKDAVKAMVGHKSSDITESAYTTRDIEWLRTDIEKLT